MNERLINILRLFTVLVIFNYFIFKFRIILSPELIHTYTFQI